MSATMHMSVVMILVSTEAGALHALVVVPKVELCAAT